MAREFTIYGGTFDPVHHGHLIVARHMAEALDVPEITFVPAASPPHKSGARASASDRLDMLRLAVEGEQRLAVSDLELTKTGPSYTYDTVTDLLDRGGPGSSVRLIVGMDMLADLPNWYRSRDLVDLAEVSVAGRKPWDDRLGQIRADLADAFGQGVAERLIEEVVDTPLIDISSTQIRQRVQQGLSVRYLVPDRVCGVIRCRKLYG